MGTPGQEATKEAIARGKPMTVVEYYRAQRVFRATRKRLLANKPPRLAGYHPNMSTKIGSFGDIDYGKS